MKEASAIIQKLDQTEIAGIERTNHYALSVNGESFDLTLDDFEILTEDIPGWQVATDGPLVVALDLTLTDALIAEGYARDLVNRIQNLRKDKDFNVTDRITVTAQSHPEIAAAVESFGDYVKSETLADSLEVATDPGGDVVEWIDGEPVVIRIAKL